MDSDLIYAKTASGEEAVQKRTRVMQRNVRMVLILVDGQSTVADLCQKTGNPKLTESALTELEKSGLIELCVVQDSIWEESRKVAEEIRAAAMSRPPAKMAEFASKPPVFQPEMIDNRVFVHSDFPVQARDPSDMHISLAPLHAVGDSIDEGLDKVSASMGVEPQAQGRSASVLPDAREVWKTSGKDYGKRASEEKIDIKPIRRGPRVQRNWAGRLFAGFVGIAAVLFLTIMFFPFADYLPKIESTMSQIVGQPVKVGAIRVNFYPHPGLQLGDVKIGPGDKAVRFAEIRLFPELGSVMASKIIFSDAVASGAVLPIEWIAGLPKILESAANPSASAGVRRLGFEKTSVSFDGLVLADLEGEASLAADGRFDNLSLHAMDRSLKLETKSFAQGMNIAVEAYAWRPDKKSALVFDSIGLKARLEKDALVIDSMDLRVFDGSIQGKAVVRSGKHHILSGDVRYERINSGKLGETLGVGQQFAGEAAGTVHFSSSFDNWDNVLSGLDAEGDFVIRRGSIRGVDLPEAVRRVSGTPVHGGSTAFEDLTGKLKFASGAWQFSGLAMNSGLMQSSGYLQIGKDQLANGRMELKIRGTVNQRQVPVAISGPLNSLTVRVVGR